MMQSLHAVLPGPDFLDGLESVDPLVAATFVILAGIALVMAIGLRLLPVRGSTIRVERPERRR